jgi:signal transduction histidine kinase/CheY-like chemotaxis protein
LSAAGWGAAGVWLYPEAHLTNQVLLVFVLGGMMLGAGAILAARPEAFFSFLLLVGIPASARFLLQGETFHVAMGTLLLLFTAATLITTWHIYSTLRTSLVLRFENDDLVAELAKVMDCLEVLNQQLEQRVQHRTAELDQAVTHLRKEIAERQRAEKERADLEAKLRQAQKLEALGVLAGGIAHDFNNLLTSIAGYTTLVRDALPVDVEAARHLEEVLKASTRAATLVRKLLLFSCKHEDKPALVSVSEIVNGTLEVVRASLPTRILFREKIHPECGSIFADPDLIQQIVINLCANSREAMARRGGLLEVTLEPFHGSPSASGQQELPDGVYACLTVRDTGPGIAPENADRLFEPFFSTKPRAKGAGLGLSVVHGIVTTYGGLVTFESTPPYGAAFFVFLPVQPGRPKVPEEVSEPPATASQRILLVDDEEPIARLAAVLLRRLGHTVSSTTSSVKALALFKKDPGSFDFVITDLTMPQMNGKELIHQLRQIRSDIPIIMMSGFNDPSITMEGATGLGIASFVAKPFSPAELADAIRTVLQRKSDLPAIG